MPVIKGTVFAIFHTKLPWTDVFMQDRMSLHKPSLELAKPQHSLSPSSRKSIKTSKHARL